LQELKCYSNQLTKLPENLPSSLQELYCCDNQLTKLPENLPNSLQELYCSNNPYLYIPKKYAVKFNIEETYNYNYCAFKIQSENATKNFIGIYRVILTEVIWN